MDTKQKRGQKHHFSLFWYVGALFALAILASPVQSIIRMLQYDEDAVSKSCVVKMSNSVEMLMTTAGRGNDTLSISYDGGATWRELDRTAYYAPDHLFTSPPCHNIIRLDDLNFLYYRSRGAKFTHDGGKSWHNLTFPTNLTCWLPLIHEISFTDTTTGYADVTCEVKYYGEKDAPRYQFATSDSGKTWQSIEETSE